MRKNAGMCPLFYMKEGIIRLKSIKNKIILNTVVVTIALAIVMTGILAVSANILTDTVLDSTLEPFAKIAAQSVEGNLHLLGDRIFMLADNDTITSPETTREQKQAQLAQAASGIEFIWLGLYHPDGTLYTGYADSPSAIKDGYLYEMLKATGNLVIDDTAVTKDELTVAVGIPVYQNGELAYYLAGAYRYDLLNDVLSNIHIGHSGYALIINHQGKIIAHENTNVVFDGHTIQSLYTADTAMQTLSQNIRAGEIGVAQIPIGGKQNYVAYAPVRGVNWSLAILVPQSEFAAVTNRTILYSILIVAVLIALAILFITRFSNKISRSLTAVTDRIQGLAQGDLTAPVQISDTKDEAHTLSVALRDTINDVSGYIFKLREALSSLSQSNLNIRVHGEFAGDFVVMKDSLNSIIDFLNEILANLKQSATLIEQGAREVSTSAQIVNESSERQSEAVSRLVTETDRIASDIGVVSDNVETARCLTDEIVSRVSQGSEQMNNTLEAMERIRNNSDEITKITKLMEDIAFQTNILALNAGVEAARAGAAGKGFAVVAMEVRELAAKSAQSSQQTAEMIAHSTAAVADGVKYAKLTAQFMEQIAGISGRISQITEELVASVRSEKEALDNVSGDISQISDLARHNLDASRESAVLSEELSAYSQELADMAARFKLRSGRNAKGGL